MSVYSLWAMASALFVTFSEDSGRVIILIIVHLGTACQSVKEMATKTSLNSSPEPSFQPIGLRPHCLCSSTRLLPIYLPSSFVVLMPCI